MRLVLRSLLALGVVVVAVGAYVGWATYGSWPVPDGYSFPRHSIWGGPTALFEGSLENVDGCIRTAGDGSFAVVWPPGYRLSVKDGQPVIQGGSEDVRLGEPVAMGGGFYEAGQPPPGSRDIGGCAAPYFLSTGFTD